MVKTIIKETCIMLLLLACVVLIFGIAFYEYIPISKVTPSKVAYEVPEDIKQDLELDVSQEGIQTQYITFSVDGRDLDQYEDSGRLVEGKLNPFAPYSETSNNSTTTNGTVSDGNEVPVNNTNKNSVGTYYPNTGTK